MREEPGRQHAVREIPATSRDGADIRARPEEVIGLGDDDPRREIIKAEMSFQEGRYLDRIGGVFGCRMGDRHDDDDLAPVDDLARGDDCTRPGLATSSAPTEMLAGPEIRIRDHKPRRWCR
jgi:hypothetical protein